MRFQAASDQALLVYLGEEIGVAAHGRVVRCFDALQKKPPGWIRNIQPAYCSLLIEFDATRVDHAEVRAKITEYEKLAEEMPAAEGAAGGNPRLLWRRIRAGHGRRGGEGRLIARESDRCCIARELITRIFWVLRQGSPIWGMWQKKSRCRGW